MLEISLKKRLDSQKESRIIPGTILKPTVEIMSQIIFCYKLQKEAEAMKKQPFPGPLGEKIFKNISQKAWDMWLAHQTMLINEYRLNLIDPQARAFLHEEMEKYFFGNGSEKPVGFSPRE
ncbi:protein that protects iron-sulfur proteins against oxidative damage [Legionella israelensis]|uniref:Probable Fe(2+)-trafficking protein n=2 Tax=Legionella israelensis TaxID=454 RepID=A0A0W0VHK8_9GAMM|nr:protein that protects iron-sulfur proteins against oxidative damage [Legionella israelensis]SCY43664.1 Fe-S cluster biosynthesis and repair protein YggX [Legionella israelensis DSM 19235]STX58836.1 protein that protects iron-sulfur proteins against oxidative damage [Legionella israelensis]